MRLFLKSLLALYCLCFAGAANAQLSIDITKSEFDPIRIAVTDFQSDDVRTQQIAEDIAV